jgi:hypothetical protein
MARWLTRGRRHPDAGPRLSPAEKHLPQHGLDQDLAHLEAIEAGHHFGTVPLHATHATMPSSAHATMPTILATMPTTHTPVTSLHSAHAHVHAVMTLGHTSHAATGLVHGGLARGMRIGAVAPDAGSGRVAAFDIRHATAVIVRTTMPGMDIKGGIDRCGFMAGVRRVIHA